MSDVDRIARVAAEECSRVWRSEWVRVIAEKDAEIKRLREALADAEHLCKWLLQSDITEADKWRAVRDLGITLALALNPPQQVSSACGHQRHGECHFAACVCECHNPPQKKDGEWMRPISNPLVKPRIVNGKPDGHHQCTECHEFDFGHRVTCSQMRPFPIQRGGSIPWWLAEVAFEYYHENWKSQSLERLAERGGFGVSELVGFIRREL